MLRRLIGFIFCLDEAKGRERLFQDSLRRQSFRCAECRQAPAWMRERRADRAREMLRCLVKRQLLSSRPVSSSLSLLSEASSHEGKRLGEEA